VDTINRGRRHCRAPLPRRGALSTRGQSLTAAAAADCSYLLPLFLPLLSSPLLGHSDVCGGVFIRDPSLPMEDMVLLPVHAAHCRSPLPCSFVLNSNAGPDRCSSALITAADDWSEREREAGAGRVR